MDAQKIIHPSLLDCDRAPPMKWNPLPLWNVRVGLLLCHDLRIAGQMISQEQSLLGSTMGPRDKIKELVLYSISEDYFTARRAIGVTVV